MKYVGLLRGINVGGNTKVPMEELRHVCEGLGFTSVKTILNSGNVVFETHQTKEDIVQKELEQALEKQFNFPIRVLVRPFDELERLLQEDPFKGIPVTKDTRLYVTFLSEKHALTKDDVAKAAVHNAQITRLTTREICSVINITPQKNTTDLMEFLGKLFGKNITTRNWNTLIKLGAL